MSPIPYLRGLSVSTLADLAGALRAGRIPAPASRFAVQYAAPGISNEAADELARFINEGATVGHAALLLETILAERVAFCSLGARLELVTTGPDVGGRTRDTGVVMRELFARATDRVLVIGFTVHQGRRVFAELAERMVAVPSLAVRLCLDVARRPGDTSTDEAVLRRFGQRFAQQEWPGPRLPTVFYDPRALLPPDRPRASLHAKCIVVDGTFAFVGSANLTEAAQLRNIEIGLLARFAEIASGIERHVETLIAAGALRPLHV
jgi:phosphatidylserine/phosphatidylglycerophosphate/cardiolipin synthase-like enzyme